MYSYPPMSNMSTLSSRLSLSKLGTSCHFCRSLLLCALIIPFLSFTLHSRLSQNRTADWPPKHINKSGKIDTVLNDTIELQRSVGNGISEVAQAPAHTTTALPSQSGQAQNSSSFKNNMETSQANPKAGTENEPLIEQSAGAASFCNMPQPPSYPLQPPEDQNLPEELSDYIKFHKRGRECLLDPDCKQKPKILVARCPRERLCLGLGDRMRGLVFSFTIALITKRVYFLHEMSSPFPLNVGLAPSSIDWTLPLNVPFNDSWPYLEWYWCRQGRPCAHGSPFPTNFSNFEDQGQDINMHADDIVKLFKDKPVVSLASRIPFRYVRFIERNPHLSNTYAELARKIIRSQVNIHRLLFKPSEGTRQKMKALEFKGDHYSVHIRNGIDANETNLERFRYLATHEDEATDNVLECLERVIDGENITNVFLASDSSKTKEMFLRKSREKSFDVHVMQKETLHYDGIRVQAPAALDAICDGFLDVFTDLFMLSRGKVMVKTGSNFADFAGSLGRDQQVIKFKPGTSSIEDCRQSSL